MNYKGIVMSIVVGLVMVGLSGCTSAPSDSGVKQDAQKKLDDAAAKLVEARAAAHKAYEDGYAAAKAVYDPPHHVVANRTARYTLDVDPGKAEQFNFNSTHEMTLVWKVTHYGGPRFDVFVVPGSAYKGLGQPDEMDECSDWMATTTERSCVLPPGTYMVVIDNTNLGGAKPSGTTDDDVVRVRFTYEVYWTEAHGA